MKPTTTVQSAAEPYRATLANLHALDEALSNLRRKKTLLEDETSAINESLGTLEQSRPQLLEAVLSGAQPEAVLTEQEGEATRLKSELKSKSDLIVLIDAQMASKTKDRVDGKARLERLRNQVFAAIEADILAKLPPDFLPYLVRLSAVSSIHIQSRSGMSVIEGLMPKLKHDDWQRERIRLLEEYGVPSY